MAANAIAREQSLSEHVAALNEQAEEQAAAGEWEAVSPLLSKRDALLREIESSEREGAVRASIRSTDRIRALVEQAKEILGRELGRLQRGREATQSYGINS